MARSAGTETVRVEGLNQLLRALRAFPKEAQAELREEANRIATGLMLPSWQKAARTVPIYGEYLAQSMRVKRDRVPALSIGYKRPVVSGGKTSTTSRSGRTTKHQGASSIMLRWPTHSGDDGASFYDFPGNSWINQATGYKAEAMERYGDAIERVVRQWNRGGI